MPPSTCPLCSRIYCDHTHAERGQTYAEMMGDPPDQYFMSEEEKRREALHRLQCRASDLLETQAVDRVEFGPMGTDEVVFFTEEGSAIHFAGHSPAVERLGEEPLTYTRAEDQELVLWAKGNREEIRGTVRSIAYQEPLPEKWSL